MNEELAFEQEVLAGLADWPHNPPWYHAPDLAQRVGVKVDEAHEQLVRLYPPNTCKEMIRTGNGSLVAALALRDGMWTPDCEHLLRLGADLADCPGWHTDPGRLARLRTLAEFEGVRFEVALGAAALRRGLRCEFSPSPTRGTKSADLAIREADVKIVLELKWPQISQYDINLEQLHEMGMRATIGIAHDLGPHRLLLHLSAKVQNSAATLRTQEFAKTWSQSIANRVRAIYQLGTPILDDRHSLDDAGEIEIRSIDSGLHFAVSIPGKSSGNKSGIRVLRGLREASDQLADYQCDIRAAVVLISSRDFRAQDGLHLIAQEIDRDPAALRSIDVAIIVNPPTPFQPLPVVYAAMVKNSQQASSKSVWIAAIADASRIAGGTL